MWCLGWIEVWGWDELGSAVLAEPDCPAVAVDQSMVMSAEGDAVVAVGVAAVEPWDNVVNIAPTWWAVTAWKGAAAVADQDCRPGGTGEQAAGATDIDRDPGTVEDDRQDPAVAGQPADHGGGEFTAGVERPGCEAGGEGVVVDGHGELGWLAAVDG